MRKDVFLKRIITDDKDCVFYYSVQHKIYWIYKVIFINDKVILINILYRHRRRSFLEEKLCYEHGRIATASYLPTPPLGQDMTLGQFLSGVLLILRGVLAV